MARGSKGTGVLIIPGLMAGVLPGLASVGCGDKKVDPFIVAPECLARGQANGGSGDRNAPTVAPSGSRPRLSVSGPVVTATEAPPAISGGTMLALHDGRTIAVADADRDRLFFFDTIDLAVRGEVGFAPHDEPGRLVEDGAGRVHVVLRRRGVIATVDVATATVPLTRSLCATPRGLAYDPTADRLYLACASGELVTVAPLATTPERTVRLERDLRDVVIADGRLLVSRFRSAEILVVDADGRIGERIRPGVFSHQFAPERASFQPAVAWNMKSRRDGSVVMIHQRGKEDPVRPMPGGYGGGDPCSSIVHTAVTRVMPGQKPAVGPAIPRFVLPVDIAISPSGTRVALVSAGDAQTGAATSGEPTSGAPTSGAPLSSLFVTDLSSVADDYPGGCDMDDDHGPSGVGPACTPIGNPTTGGTPALSPPTQPTPPPTPGSVDCRKGSIPVGGQLVSAVFLDENRIIVQRREPSELVVVTLSANNAPASFSVPLGRDSRADTGHALFHADTGAGLACASCHPEGHEDGRTWNFLCDGPRRTQDIGGQLTATEPFHWSGDLANFESLMTEVFVSRMSGPMLPAEHLAAIRHWVDSVPRRAPLRDATAAEVVRGKAIFEDPTVGCASCHNGEALTNNTSVEVGTGARFQVPTLRGVGWRAPFMHNGCAANLDARFGNPDCSGGDAHGHTSQLDAGQIADLVAYLESL